MGDSAVTGILWTFPSESRSMYERSRAALVVVPPAIDNATVTVMSGFHPKRPGDFTSPFTKKIPEAVGRFAVS
jgi:hypothetical protein